MLTEQEREWLERRKNLCGRCELNIYDNPCVRYGRAGKTGKCKGFDSRNVGSDDFRDAAEFDARVAENLTDHRMRNILPCKGYKEGLCAHPLKYCAWCRMKYARLAAEAEMDAEKS